MKKAALLYISVLFNCISFGASPKQAEKLYRSGQYVDAGKQYEELLKQGESAALLYNLGNCYFKDNHWGKAILYYEKALKHAPDDEDIRFNLKMARERTLDKTVTPSPGIKMWFYSQLLVLSPDTWTWLGILFGVLALVLLAMGRYLGKRLLRITGTIAVAPFICLLLFGWILNSHLTGRNEAIILEPSVDIKTSPDANAKATFILHEGTKVRVSREKSEWTEISIDSDRKGWIKNTALAVI